MSFSCSLMYFALCQLALLHLCSLVCSNITNYYIQYILFFSYTCSKFILTLLQDRLIQVIKTRLLKKEQNQSKTKCKSLKKKKNKSSPLKKKGYQKRAQTQIGHLSSTAALTTKATVPCAILHSRSPCFYDTGTLYKDRQTSLISALNPKYALHELLLHTSFCLQHHPTQGLF